MARIFLRVQDGDGAATTHPLSAFEYLESSPTHTVYIIIKTGSKYPLRALAQCRSQEEARHIEKHILKAFAIAVRSQLLNRDPDNLIDILDLNSIADVYLKAFRANNSIDEVA